MTDPIRHETYRAAVPQIILSLVPLSMFFFNKSSTLLLVIAAAISSCACLYVLFRARFAGFPDAFKTYVSANPALSAIVLLTIAYCAVSCAWSPNPGRSLSIFLGAFLVALCGVLVLACARGGGSRRILDLVVIVLIVSSVAICVEEYLGMPLHKLIGVRSEVFALKRTAICNLMITIALSRYIKDWYGLTVLLLSYAVLILAIFMAYSGAAAFAGLATLGFLALNGVLDRTTMARLIKIAILALFLISPVIGYVGASHIDSFLVRILHNSHLKERIEIWNDFNIAYSYHPIIGFGFGSAQEIGDYLGRTAGIDLGVIKELHSHNAYLQILVELGLVGVVLSYAVLWLVIDAISRSARDQAPLMALFVCCASMMLLSHSPWQPWWIAVIGASVYWIRLGDASEPVHRNG